METLNPNQTPTSDNLEPRYSVYRNGKPIQIGEKYTHKGKVYDVPGITVSVDEVTAHHIINHLEKVSNDVFTCEVVSHEPKQANSKPSEWYAVYCEDKPILQYKQIPIVAGGAFDEANEVIYPSTHDKTTAQHIKQHLEAVTGTEMHTILVSSTDTAIGGSD